MMNARSVFWSLISLTASTVVCSPQVTAPGSEEVLVDKSALGRFGGRLVVAQRTEPKTLNPVTAVDGGSRAVIGLMTADLIHINRQSQQTEPSLAKSWTVSRDGRIYILRLRRGLRFSDGHPFDANDVLFSFQVYLDEKLHSPQRELLVVGGKPIVVRKLDAYTVQFELAQPYAAAERLFDSIAILPRHRLRQAHEEGTLDRAWGVTTPPEQLAGLGAFRLKEYVPGQHVVLQRNPYYWKTNTQGNRLPYLDEIVEPLVASADAQAMRFEAGETDVISRLSAENFSVLEKSRQSRGFRLHDLGPGLEYNFLLFNLNDLSFKNLPSIAHKQDWFRKAAFRQAVSAAIDREGIVRLVYRGRATPLWVPFSPGNKRWTNLRISQPPRSPARARQILRAAGFSWGADGHLTFGKDVIQFSILTSAENSQRNQVATMIQHDLKEIGVDAHVVSLEFRTLLDRVFKTYDYEAVVMALADGDADPNTQMNIWSLRGSTHLWNLEAGRSHAPWEEKIDRLMQQQMITLDVEQRKRLYDNVQELAAENLPLIGLVSPNILVAAKQRLDNFRPAILNDYTLWNAEQLHFRKDSDRKDP